MAQAGNVVLGRFDELVRMYKAPPAHALTEEFYETDPKRDFARGFAIQTVGPLPIAFAKQMMAAKGAWGWGLRRVMMDYNHWSALGLLGEILPWADNRVQLAEEKDRFGLPRGEGELRPARQRQEADRVWQEQSDGSDARGRRRGGRSGSRAMRIWSARRAWAAIRDRRWWTDSAAPMISPISSSAMAASCPRKAPPIPGLTIQALAARTADYLIAQGDAIFSSSRRDQQEPRIRYDLSPPFTRYKGNPRLA